ncbi:uncharacterized protein LOC108742574 isoform X2 [Agrilus planipennis]|uniref:Uncharacterized protein LOC108742574 isoform X2 n=1 Tax=Agrilus planipennis TaxID=224129 RepID=A0A1W4XKQ5_AGRPL|nr:uncharacterized protein LOC108742574 isoform X2 [Agrilus planipennis]
MFFTMKGVLATILFILGCRINASIPGCQEIERSSTRYFDGIMVKLQQSVIQQLTKNERKERHLHSNTLNKTDIQSKEEINGTPGCDPNSSNNV